MLLIYNRYNYGLFKTFLYMASKLLFSLRIIIYKETLRISLNTSVVPVFSHKSNWSKRSTSANLTNGMQSDFILLIKISYRLVWRQLVRDELGARRNRLYCGTDARGSGGTPDYRSSHVEPKRQPDNNIGDDFGRFSVSHAPNS